MFLTVLKILLDVLDAFPLVSMALFPLHLSYNVQLPSCSSSHQWRFLLRALTSCLTEINKFWGNSYLHKQYFWVNSYFCRSQKHLNLYTLHLYTSTYVYKSVYKSLLEQFFFLFYKTFLELFNPGNYFWVEGIFVKRC